MAAGMSRPVVERSLAWFKALIINIIRGRVYARVILEDTKKYLVNDSSKRARVDPPFKMPVEPSRMRVGRVKAYQRTQDTPPNKNAKYA